MLNHLLELRRRALSVFACFVGLFLLFFFLAPDLFHFLMRPLLQALPKSDSLIATQLTSPLLTPIKLAADAALLGCAPLALFHAWRFAAPGLYPNERAGLGGAIVISMVLFCIGVLFCFYLVLPFMLQFLANALPPGVRLMPDMADAVSFITRMLLIFGVCFQVPLLCMLLVRLQILEITTLKIIRPYIIVTAFTVGMILTPPDVLSQVMLAIPLCLLYELGIILAVVFAKSATTAQPQT